MSLFAVLHGEKEERLFSTNATCGTLQSALLDLATDTALYVQRRGSGGAAYSATAPMDRMSSAASLTSRTAMQEATSRTGDGAPVYVAVDLVPYSFVKELVAQGKIHSLLLENGSDLGEGNRKSIVATSKDGVLSTTTGSTTNGKEGGKRVSSGNSGKEKEGDANSVAATNVLLNLLNDVPLVGLSTTGVTQAANSLSALRGGTGAAGEGGAGGGAANKDTNASPSIKFNTSERFVLIGFRATESSSNESGKASKDAETTKKDAVSALLQKATQSGTTNGKTPLASDSQEALLAAKQLIGQCRLLHKTVPLYENSLPSLVKSYEALKVQEEEDVKRARLEKGGSAVEAAGGGSARNKKKSVAGNGNGGNLSHLTLTEEEQLLLKYKGALTPPETFPLKSKQNYVSITIEEAERLQKEKEEKELQESLGPGKEEEEEKGKKAAAKKKPSVSGGAKKQQNADEEESLPIPLSTSAAKLLNSNNNTTTNVNSSPIVVNFQTGTVGLPKGFTLANIHTFGSGGAGEGSGGRDVLQLMSHYPHVVQQACHLDVLWHGSLNPSIQAGGAARGEREDNSTPLNGAGPPTTSGVGSHPNTVTEDVLLQAFLNEYFILLKERLDTLVSQVVETVNEINNGGADAKKKKK